MGNKLAYVSALFFSTFAVAWGQTTFAVAPGDFVAPTVITSGSRITFEVSGRPGDVWHFEALESSIAYRSICAEVADEANNILLAFRSTCSSADLLKTFTATKQAIYKISIGPLAANDAVVHFSFGCLGVCPDAPTDVPRAKSVVPRDLTTTPASDTVSAVEGFHLYRFYSAPPTQVTLDLLRMGTIGSPYFRLYTPTGEFIDSVTSSLEAKKTYPATRTGYYLLYVADVGLNDDMRYRLTLACSPTCLAAPIGPPPQGIRVAPTALSLTGTVGGASQSAQLQVLNSVDGTSPVPFTISTSGGSWLTVTPASGMTPGSVTIVANLTGLAIGSYSGTVSVMAPGVADPPVNVPVGLTVAPPPGVQATPATLSFNYMIGSPAPSFQSVTISSPNTQVPFSVTVSGGAWLIPSVFGGTTPETLNVIVNTTNLAPQTYTGKLTISAEGLVPAVVNVTLTVSPPLSPQLGVNAPPLILSATQGGSPATSQIQISNTGGGTLSFSAANSGDAWLSVSPTNGTVDNAATAAVTVTADPGGLSPGTYQGSVTVMGAGSTFALPVTFSVVAPTPVVLLTQAGLSFTGVAQAGAPLPQQLGILNAGSGTLNWMAGATTLSGGNWLLLSPTTGTVQQPFLDVSLVNVSVDPSVLASLAPGDYYGQIQVADQAVPAIASNSPQTATVVLSVLAAGSNPGPETVPSSLIFTGVAGVSPPAQTVTVGIRRASADRFQSGSIGGGFGFAPTTAQVAPNQSVPVRVTPDFSIRNPGDIDHGTITMQFSDGTARTISILTVVAPSAAGNPRIGPRELGDCPNLNLQWRSPSPPTFSVVQGRGQTLELQIVDDCGKLIGPGSAFGASVLASFSNRDANLPLVHVGNGVWTGTWNPVNQAPGPVMVNVTAFNLSAGYVQTGQASTLNGTVVFGPTPTVTADSVIHEATRAGGAPIAPGALVNIGGSDGTQAFLGSEPVQMLPGGNGVLNVQVPFDIPVNTQLQLTLRRGTLLSLPVQLVAASAQPGVFTLDNSGSGPAVIYRDDGLTLAQGDTPAAVGETVFISCTGLGVVNPDGTAANTIAVTIDGHSAAVVSSGLVAGQPGLYLVGAVVPDGSDVGDSEDVPVVVTADGHASQVVTIRRPRPTGGNGGNPKGRRPGRSAP